MLPRKVPVLSSWLHIPSRAHHKVVPIGHCRHRLSSCGPRCVPLAPTTPASTCQRTSSVCSTIWWLRYRESRWLWLHSMVLGPNGFCGHRHVGARAAADVQRALRCSVHSIWRARVMELSSTGCQTESATFKLLCFSYPNGTIMMHIVEVHAFRWPT